MSFLASRRWRIFLIAWIVYSVHFATNVVREHYPAFTIVDHGTFRVDEYQGFHSDIFVHRDGHSVIGNQVLVSLFAAVPLFVFDPALDALEEHSKAKLAREGVQDAEYRTDKRNRVNFFRLVKERGLDLRFGAATFITTAFFMAPLTALFLVYFYGVLRQRGLTANHATALTLLFGFGTPLFYRATVLGHNMFVMFGMFASFVLLWVQPGAPFPVTYRRRILAGFFAGITLATDYISVLIIPLLYLYLFLPRLRSASWTVSFRESLAFVAGTIPPLAFLLYSQWAMYGHPLYPGQHWMPDQNIYVSQGMRGFTLPSPGLFFDNLFHPAYGMYSWGPVLLLALIPAWRYRPESLVLPVRERWFLIVAWVVLMLFVSANQYSHLQFNSGFRYLLPLVPFMILAIADHWVRLGAGVRTGIAVVAVLHSWVLAVYREPLLVSWRLLFEEGPQLTWYRVMGMTSNPDTPLLGTWWVPSLILGITLALVAGIWRYGARLESQHDIAR